MLLGTENYGVLKSTDNAASWTVISKGLPCGETVETFYASNGYLFAGTERNGIYRSSDNGKTWVKKQRPENTTYTPKVTSFCSIGSAIFAANYGNIILKSSDIGNTGENAASGLSPVTCITAIGNTLLPMTRNWK